MWLFHPADVVHVRELAAMRRNTSQHKNKLVSLSVDALQQRWCRLLGHGGRGLLAPAHSAALTLLLLPRGNGPSAAGLQGGRDLLWVQTPPKEEHPETCNMQARCESGLPRLSWRRGGDRTTGATAMGQQGHSRRQNWWRAARDGERCWFEDPYSVSLAVASLPPSVSPSA